MRVIAVVIGATLLLLTPLLIAIVRSDNDVRWEVLLLVVGFALEMWALNREYARKEQKSLTRFKARMRALGHDFEHAKSAEDVQIPWRSGRSERKLSNRQKERRRRAVERAQKEAAATRLRKTLRQSSNIPGPLATPAPEPLSSSTWTCPPHLASILDALGPELQGAVLEHHERAPKPSLDTLRHALAALLQPYERLPHELSFWREGSIVQLSGGSRVARAAAVRQCAALLPSGRHLFVSWRRADPELEAAARAHQSLAYREALYNTSLVDLKSWDPLRQDAFKVLWFSIEPLKNPNKRVLKDVPRLTGKTARRILVIEDTNTSAVESLLDLDEVVDFEGLVLFDAGEGGGAVFANVAYALKLPIYGVARRGENTELEPFNAQDFARELLPAKAPE